MVTLRIFAYSLVIHIKILDCNPDDPGNPQLQSDDTFYCPDRDVSECNDTIIGDIEMKILCQVKCDYCIPPTTTTEYTGPPTTTTTPIPPTSQY